MSGWSVGCTDAIGPAPARCVGQRKAEHMGLCISWSVEATDCDQGFAVEREDTADADRGTVLASSGCASAGDIARTVGVASTPDGRKDS